MENSVGGKYFRINAKVDVTTEIARSWLSELANYSRESGVHNYFFDVRNVKNISNVTDNYNFAHHDVSSLNIEKTGRHAILVSPDDHSHDFIETSMLNAGYNVKIFHDEDQAINWLEEA